MNLRPLFAYLVVVCIILSLIGQLHWVIGLIGTLFGLWCLIILDQDADAQHKRASHQKTTRQND